MKTHYEQLRDESRDLGEYIANELFSEGFLSEKGIAMLSSLNISIALYIHDYISEVKTDEATAKAEGR